MVRAWSVCVQGLLALHGALGYVVPAIRVDAAWTRLDGRAERCWQFRRGRARLLQHARSVRVKGQVQRVGAHEARVEMVAKQLSQLLKPDAEGRGIGLRHIFFVVRELQAGQERCVARLIGIDRAIKLFNDTRDAPAIQQRACLRQVLFQGPCVQDVRAAPGCLRQVHHLIVANDDAAGLLAQGPAYVVGEPVVLGDVRERLGGVIAREVVDRIGAQQRVTYEYDRQARRVGGGWRAS